MMSVSHKNIVVALNAGLGNQLFQLACGYALAKRTKRNLVLDSSWYVIQKYRPRRHSLLRKLISIEPPSDNSPRISFCDFKLTSAIAWIYRKLQHGRKSSLSLFGTDIFYETSFHITDPRLLVSLPPRNVLLCGWWQTAQHFLNARNDLLKILVPQFRLSDSFLRLSEDIKHRNSVSIHVRRGDFLNFQGSTMTSAFYKAATKEIRRMGVENPIWHVFSEDQEWCRSELGYLAPNVRFISLNSKHAEIEEMLLMSQCRYGAIIANSTFSWWGAALGDRPERPVISSKFRYGAGRGNTDLEWILPNWKTVNEF